MSRQCKIKGALLQDIAEAICNFPATEVAQIFNIKESTVGNYTSYAKSIYKENPNAEETYCRLNKSLRHEIKSRILTIKDSGKVIDFLEAAPKRRYKTGVTRKYAPRKSNGRVALPINNTPREKSIEAKVTKADLKDVLKVIGSGFETLTKLIEKM